jgi:hypothetical protein
MRTFGPEDVGNFVGGEQFVAAERLGVGVWGCG